MDIDVSMNSLLNGAVGSAISLVGAVVAAQLIIRHERSLRHAESVISDDAARELLKREAAIDLQVAAARLVMENTRIPFSLFGSARIEILQALGHLVGVTLSPHRAVAD